jgi:hypothetical protein
MRNIIDGANETGGSPAAPSRHLASHGAPLSDCLARRVDGATVIGEYAVTAARDAWDTLASESAAFRSRPPGRES